MILLQCVNLSKSFGSEPILSNIKLEIQSRERVALVGRNGAGKSTLLKIIAGELPHDTGDIISPKHLEIGYLSQDTGLESSLSIWDEMLTVFKPLRQMEKQLRQLEEKMSDSENRDYDKLLSDYDHLQNQFKTKGGYQYEAEIRSILSGLNFDSFDYSTKISTLSGGQKTRLALGKLLLTKPELLILDEPTNHLDIETLTWLETYLTNYHGAILIVSHDRYFLDKIVNYVYDLSRTKAIKYHGNYSDYLVEKAKQFELEMKQYEKQQSEVAKLEDFVQKNIARASTTKRAQSRRKSLEKMSLMDRPSGELKSASFSFEITRQSGGDVLKTDNLSIGYPNQSALCENINLHITRNESVALIGPNGVGKSTLLKTLTKGIKALSGSIFYGSNVTIGYYDQEQTNLTSNKQVLHELWDEYPSTPEKDIRTVLGNFLFSGDDVLKIVNDLSGGEKARLALAKLMMQKANFLIFDEPTNHLDLDSKEVLEAALIDYPGTILFVSHDRYFLNRLATRIVELPKQGEAVATYLGDYDYYLMKKDEQKQREILAEEEQTESQVSPKNDKADFHKDKEAKRLERKRLRRIEEIEEKVESIEAQTLEDEQLLCHPDVFQNHERVIDIQQSIDDQKAELELLMEEWEQLQLEDE